MGGTPSPARSWPGRRALFSDRLFTLPSIGADLPVVLSYNSSVWSTSTPSAVTGTAGSGWVITGFDQRLMANGDGSVTYFGHGGLSGVFTPDGSGGLVAPPKFQATLTGSATSGYVLVVHVSQQHLAFTVGGWLTSVTDRNGNVTSFGYSPYGYPSSITSARTRRRTRRERGGIGGEQYPIPWPREIEVVATWDQSG